MVMVLPNCAFSGPLVEAPEDCPFPPRTMMLVLGDSPVSSHGLVAPGDLEHDPPGGTVYVTAEPISRRLREPMHQMWCVVYASESPDAPSGMNGPVPEGWTPSDG